MNIVALPGRRAQTEVWLKRVLEAARYPDAEVTRYRHWDSEAEASVAHEAQRLSDFAPRLVIAKSMGTVIAATAHASHRFRPGFAVLIGTPYAALDDEAVGHLRRFAADVDTLFIQQAADPGGPASELGAALALRRGEVVEVPGDDHLYRDVDALGVIIRRWHEQHRLG